MATLQITMLWDDDGRMSYEEMFDSLTHLGGYDIEVEEAPVMEPSPPTKRKKKKKKS